MTYELQEKYEEIEALARGLIKSDRLYVSTWTLQLLGVNLARSVLEYVRLHDMEQPRIGYPGAWRSG